MGSGFLATLDSLEALERSNLDIILKFVRHVCGHILVPCLEASTNSTKKRTSQKKKTKLSKVKKLNKGMNFVKINDFIYNIDRCNYILRLEFT